MELVHSVHRHFSVLQLHVRILVRYSPRTFYNWRTQQVGYVHSPAWRSVQTVVQVATNYLSYGFSFA